MTALLETHGLSKSFAGIPALSGVSLELMPGSILAIVGENGAGKSTLMKTIAGVHKPSGGTMRFKGRDTVWKDAEDARVHGISTIFQEFVLLPNLSVAENLFLGREPRRGPFVDKRARAAASRKALERLGLDIDPDRLVSSLGVAEQQMVEIAKGVMRDADVFIFDEPTAALGDREAQRLFEIIETLKAEGKGILYVSHRLPEIFTLCDSAVVLKDSAFVGAYRLADVTPADLVNAMVGRRLDQLYPQRDEQQSSDELPVVVLKDVQLAGRHGRVNLTVGLREIVGLAGLEGQGQIDVTRALYGEHKVLAGTIDIFGQAREVHDARDAIALGIGLVPEDRKADGLFLDLGVDDNILAGLLPGKPSWSFAPRGRQSVDAEIARLRIRLNDAGQPIGSLSGGNQQKGLLARWLARGIKLLVCEEPTRGVDIGAKAEIYKILRELADAGIPVLVTSRELPELLGLCDRIVVLRDGASVGNFPHAEATEQSVMHAAIYGEPQ